MPRPTKKPNSWLHKKLKLSHHKHTGKRLPRHHTSYGALVAISLFTGLMLLVVARAFSANASAITLDGSLNFSGFVPPPQPYPVATIESPLNSQVFGTTPIDIHGSCATYPEKVAVAVIDNGSNLGQALCNQGRYDFKIDLLITNRSGINYLRIRQYELIDNYRAAGPESDVIKVYFHPNSDLSNRLVISAQLPGPAVKAGQSYTLKLKIQGGLAPYAIAIKWGDGKEDVVSRAVAGDFSLTHTYQSDADYTILINASDSQNQKAYFQDNALIGFSSLSCVSASQRQLAPYFTSGLALIRPVLIASNLASTGKATCVSIGGSSTASYISSHLKALIPVYSVATGSVLIFWLGEKYAFIKAHQSLWKTKSVKK